MIYFDNAATSYNRPPCVKEAVAAAIDAFGNPSRGAYSASLDADRCLFETRMQLAALAGAEGPDCVAFTMNATQALSTAIFGLGLQDAQFRAAAGLQVEREGRRRPFCRA